MIVLHQAAETPQCQRVGKKTNTNVFHFSSEKVEGKFSCQQHDLLMV